MKKCSACGESKPIDEFHKRANRSSGRYSQCRECNRKRVQEWQRNNRKRQGASTRKSYLKKTYGITEDQYYSLLDKQKECCGVCKRHASEFTKRLAVDHQHGDGDENVVRGLLCSDCNRRVIGRRKDPQIFLNAAEYLKGPFTGWVVPKRKPKKRKRK